MWLFFYFVILFLIHFRLRLFIYLLLQGVPGGCTP